MNAELSELECSLLDSYGIHETMARPFLDLGISVDEVPEIFFYNISYNTVKTFKDFGFINVADIISLASKQNTKKTISDIGQFNNQGITLNYQLLHLIKSNVSPSDAKPYTKLGIHFGLSDLIEANVPPETVTEYFSVKICDGSDIAALYNARHNPNLVKEYLDIGLFQKNLAETISLFVQNNFSPSKVSEWESKGVDHSLLSSGLKKGIMPEKFMPYIDAGIDPDRICLTEVVEKNIPPEKIISYQEVGISGIHLLNFIEKKISSDVAGAYKSVGINSPCNIELCIEKDLSPQYFQELIDMGIIIHPIVDDIDVKIPVYTIEKFKESGIYYFSAILRAYKKKTSPEISAKYTLSDGYPHSNANLLHKYGVSSKEFLEQFLSTEDLISYPNSNIYELLVKRRFLKTLKKNYNIDEKTFERYSIDVLDRLMDIVKEGVDTKKMNALFINPKSDWNGSFRNDPQTDELLNGYNVIINETSNVKHIPFLMKAYTEQYGNIDLLVISGHGSKDTIRFGNGDNSGTLYSSNLSIFKGSNTYLSDDAKVVLRSCSTGNNGKIFQSIGQRLANMFKRHTYAPAGDSITEKFILDKNEKFLDAKYDVKRVICKPSFFSYLFIN